jgi:hypothetical protein
MKIRLLLLAVLSLLPSGCGFVGKTLGTATNLVNGAVQTVTGPVRGMLQVAEPGSEKAWREKAAAEKLRKSPSPDDRSRTQEKRHH